MTVSLKLFSLKLFSLQLKLLSSLPLPFPFSLPLPCPFLFPLLLLPLSPPFLPFSPRAVNLLLPFPFPLALPFPLPVLLPPLLTSHWLPYWATAALPDWPLPLLAITPPVPAASSPTVRLATARRRAPASAPGCGLSTGH